MRGTILSADSSMVLFVSSAAMRSEVKESATMQVKHFLINIFDLFIVLHQLYLRIQLK